MHQQIIRRVLGYNSQSLGSFINEVVSHEPGAESDFNVCKAMNPDNLFQKLESSFLNIPDLKTRINASILLRFHVTESLTMWNRLTPITRNLLETNLMNTVLQLQQQGQDDQCLLIHDLCNTIAKLGSTTNSE